MTISDTDPVPANTWNIKNLDGSATAAQAVNNSGTLDAFPTEIASLGRHTLLFSLPLLQKAVMVPTFYDGRAVRVPMVLQAGVTNRLIRNLVYGTSYGDEGLGQNPASAQENDQATAFFLQNSDSEASNSVAYSRAVVNTYAAKPSVDGTASFLGSSNVADGATLTKVAETLNAHRKGKQLRRSTHIERGNSCRLSHIIKI
jgi:hypothetical protein